MLNQMGVVAMLSLLVAVVPAIMAIGYAIWPTESKLALMRPLSLASVFGALAGFVAGVINGIQWLVAQNQQVTSSAALMGLCESLVPLFASFGSLTVAWLLVALGMRPTRLAALARSSRSPRVF
jgi:uncharacterized membrane protein